MNHAAILPRRLASKTIKHNITTQSAAQAKLDAFREMVIARKSAKRFEPNSEIPGGVWRDILRMTLVCAVDLLFLRDSS
jgi:hypothetical protein